MNNEFESRLHMLELLVEERAKEVNMIRHLKDIEDVKNLQHTYFDRLIHVDWENITDLFAENGAADLFDDSVPLVRGREKLSLLYREVVGELHKGTEGVFGVHPFIDIDGESAHGNGFFIQCGCTLRQSGLYTGFSPSAVLITRRRIADGG
jgi:hypothetical protein